MGSGEITILTEKKHKTEHKTQKKTPTHTKASKRKKHKIKVNNIWTHNDVMSLTKTKARAWSTCKHCNNGFKHKQLKNFWARLIRWTSAEVLKCRKDIRRNWETSSKRSSIHHLTDYVWFASEYRKRPPLVETKQMLQDVVIISLLSSKVKDFVVKKWYP